MEMRNERCSEGRGDVYRMRNEDIFFWRKFIDFDLTGGEF